MNYGNILMNKFKWSLVAKWVIAQSLAIFTSENTNFNFVWPGPYFFGGQVHGKQIHIH